MSLTEHIILYPSARNMTGISSATSLCALLAICQMYMTSFSTEQEKACSGRLWSEGKHYLA